MSLMNLIPWRNKQQDRPRAELAALSPVDRLRFEMDRMFDRFSREFFSLGNGWGSEFATESAWLPALDMAENETEYQVRLELPGVEAKNVDISISGDVVTISGTKEASREQRKGESYHTECYYGAFRRSFPLPAHVDQNAVTAEFKDGVLTLHLKKLPGIRPKKVEISAN